MWCRTEIAWRLWTCLQVALFDWSLGMLASILRLLHWLCLRTCVQRHKCLLRVLYHLLVWKHRTHRSAFSAPPFSRGVFLSHLHPAYRGSPSSSLPFLFRRSLCACNAWHLAAESWVSCLPNLIHHKSLLWYWLCCHRYSCCHGLECAALLLHSILPQLVPTEHSTRHCHR